VALSDEQNAMLRLLASGEQGYDDIAALLGIPVDEVRAKVIGALAQLEAEGKPAPNVPSPLPGGAKPAAEVVPPEPEPVQPAPSGDDDAEPAVADAVAPKGDAPATEAAGAPAAAPRPKPKAPPGPPAGPPSGGRTVTLPTGRGAWLLGGGIIGAIVVIVVVILLVSGGGGGSSSTSANEGATAPAAETGKTETGKTETAKEAGEAGSKEPTFAELTAVDGSEAKGVATFGRVKNKLALAVEVTGLEPTEEGTDSYTIWLAQSPTKMLPLVSTGVKKSGKAAGAIAAEYEVPIEILAYLASGTFDQIAITKTDNTKFAASVEAAKKAKTTPAYTGEEVVRGTITGPIIGVAKREEEQKKKGE
jgi:hypothetical protein